MTIDIICPLYNAEMYIEDLHTSILKQRNVEISSINYILTKGKDNTEQILNVITRLLNHQSFRIRIQEK